MTKRSFATAASAFSVAALLTAAVGYSAGATSRPAGAPEPAVQASETAPAPHERARQFGLNPALVTEGIKANGLSLGLLKNDRAVCVSYSTGSDSCRTPEQVEAGQSWNIKAQCAGASARTLVSGATPAGTAGVSIAISNGKVLTGTVKGGLYALDFPTPSSTEPAPQMIRFIGANSGDIEVRFPLTPAQFCPPSVD